MSYQFFTINLIAACAGGILARGLFHPRNQLRQQLAIDFGLVVDLHTFFLLLRQLLQCLEKLLGAVDLPFFLDRNIAVVVVAFGFNHQVQRLRRAILRNGIVKIRVLFARRCGNVDLGQLGKHHHTRVVLRIRGCHETHVVEHVGNALHRLSLLGEGGVVELGCHRLSWRRAREPRKS